MNLERCKKDRDEAHNYIGISFLAKQQYKEAKEQFEASIDQNSNNTSALCNLGLLYKIQNDYAKAIEYYDKANEVKPDDSEILNNIASLYYSQGSYSDAIVHFLKSLEKNPLDGQVLCNLGNALVNAKNYDYSWLAFEEALRLDPQNREFIDQYLSALLKVKNFEKFNRMLSSLTFLDQAIKKRYQQMGQKLKRASDKDSIKTVGGKADDQFRRDTFLRRDSIRVAISKHALSRRMTSVGTPKIQPASFEDQKKSDLLGGLL